MTNGNDTLVSAPSPSAWKPPRLQESQRWFLLCPYVDPPQYSLYS